MIPKRVLGVAQNFYCHYCNYFLTMILDNIVITMILQLYVDMFMLIAMSIFQGIVCQLEW